MSDDLPSLKKLGEEIDEARARHAPPPEPSQPTSNMAMGMRIAIELAAGLLVGGVLGYFADRFLDSAPFFLMLGLALGAAAGFRNLMRIAADLAKEDNKDNT